MKRTRSITNFTHYKENTYRLERVIKIGMFRETVIYTGMVNFNFESAIRLSTYAISQKNLLCNEILILKIQNIVYACILLYHYLSVCSNLIA